MMGRLSSIRAPNCASSKPSHRNSARVGDALVAVNALDVRAVGEASPGTACVARDGLYPLLDAIFILNCLSEGEVGVVVAVMYERVTIPFQCLDCSPLRSRSFNLVTMTHRLELNDVGPHLATVHSLRLLTVGHHGPQHLGVMSLRVNDQELTAHEIELAQELAPAPNLSLPPLKMELEVIPLLDPISLRLQLRMRCAHARHVHQKC
mmetsp:Transcript_49902/g.132610  ORF Transcript_49902/g.132610 Transcript_49902/m.132610 type:complete len:207 (-) Transcript_49902:477-1097(-)